MTTSTITYDLPDVAQRATATRLRQLLRDAEGQDPPPRLAAVESLHAQVQLLSSRALRDTVAKASVALHSAGLHGTLPRSLGAEGQHWRVVAGLALDELDLREAGALQELAAHPPAYLVAAIGRPERPGLDASATQSQWLAVAGHIVAYRLQYGISDPTRALGAQSTKPVGLAQETDWRFVLGEIRWSAGNLGGRLPDPRVLGVFDPAGAVIPQHAMETLSGESSARGRIARASERRIRAAPSHWLRERVTGALGLLRQRPADCLAELEQLEAVRRATEVLYQEELAGRPQQSSAHGRPPTPREQRGEQLSRRLHDLDTAIAGARRAWHQRTAWTTRHAEALAVGRLAAEELGLREHQALAALEQDLLDLAELHVRHLGSRAGRPAAAQRLGTLLDEAAVPDVRALRDTPSLRATSACVRPCANSSAARRRLASRLRRRSPTDHCAWSHGVVAASSKSSFSLPRIHPPTSRSNSASHPTARSPTSHGSTALEPSSPTASPTTSTALTHSAPNPSTTSSASPAASPSATLTTPHNAA